MWSRGVRKDLTGRAGRHSLPTAVPVRAQLAGPSLTELRRSGIRAARDRAPDCPGWPEIAPGELGQQGNYRFLTEFLRMPLDNGL